MKIKTASGMVEVNKRTPYGKWLIGYSQTDAWTGWHTLDATWKNQKDKKPKGVTWEAWGFMCGMYLNPLHKERKEIISFLREIDDDWKEIKNLLDKNNIPVPSGLYLDKIDVFYNINKP